MLWVEYSPKCKARWLAWALTYLLILEFERLYIVYIQYLPPSEVHHPMKELDMVSETSGTGINLEHFARHSRTILASGGVRSERADMQSENNSLNHSAAASVAAEVAEARHQQLDEAHESEEKHQTLTFQRETGQDIRDIAAFAEDWEPEPTERKAKRSNRDSSRHTFVRAKLSHHQEKAAAAARFVRQASR